VASTAFFQTLLPHGWKEENENKQLGSILIINIEIQLQADSGVQFWKLGVPPL
jgi:hypothetical protein